MNATEFSLPLDSLIQELQGEASNQYRQLCRLEDALLAAKREYDGTCAELAALYQVKNSLRRLYAGSPTTTTKPAVVEAVYEE